MGTQTEASSPKQGGHLSVRLKTQPLGWAEPLDFAPEVETLLNTPTRMHE